MRPGEYYIYVVINDGQQLNARLFALADGPRDQWPSAPVGTSESSESCSSQLSERRRAGSRMSLRSARCELDLMEEAWNHQRAACGGTPPSC